MKITYKSLAGGTKECEVVLDEHKTRKYLETQHNPSYAPLTTGQLLKFKDFQENLICLNNAYAMGELLPEIYELLKL